MIAGLAKTREKRELFARLSEHLNALADQVEQTISAVANPAVFLRGQTIEPFPKAGGEEGCQKKRAAKLFALAVITFSAVSILASSSCRLADRGGFLCVRLVWVVGGRSRFGMMSASIRNGVAPCAIYIGSAVIEASRLPDQPRAIGQSLRQTNPAIKLLSFYIYLRPQSSGEGFEPLIADR